MMWWQFTTFSLFPSAAPRLPPRYAPPLPLAARASAYALHLRTAAACLSRCIRHRRRSKAKPVRGRSSAAGGSLSITSVRPIYQNVPPRTAHLNILSPKGDKIFHTREARISPRRRRDFTRRRVPRCRISLRSEAPLCTAARSALPYFTA